MEHCVTPAVRVNNTNSQKQLSPIEFQNSLSMWLEEKGLITELRSYLKHRMISILKNCSTNNKSLNCVLKGKSLSRHAVDLMVAEYLIHNTYHYSLSIFASEAQITNILPEGTLFNNPTEYKLGIENLLNIFELIGITKASHTCEELISMYSSKNQPLLDCLINNVSNKCECEELLSKTTSIGMMEGNCKFMKNVADVLLATKLPSHIVNNLLLKINMIYDNDQKHYKDEYISVVEKLRDNIVSKNKKIQDLKQKKEILDRRIVKITKENNLLLQQNAYSNGKKDEQCVKLNISEEKLCEDNKNEPVQCTSKHCTDECEMLQISYIKCKKENEDLTLQNHEYKQQIKNLSLRCKELFSELSICQSKIQILNSNIVKDNVNEESEETGALTLDSKSSSTSLTEEILRQARSKLRELEHESEEIDLYTCFSFHNKNILVKTPYLRKLC